MFSDHHHGHHQYSNPDPKQGLLLTPGERADIVFTPQGDGPVTIEWHDFPRGTHTAFEKDGGGVGLGHDHHNDGKASPRTQDGSSGARRFSSPSSDQYGIGDQGRRMDGAR